MADHDPADDFAEGTPLGYMVLASRTGVRPRPCSRICDTVEEARQWLSHFETPGLPRIPMVADNVYMVVELWEVPDAR